MFVYNVASLSTEHKRSLHALSALTQLTELSKAGKKAKKVKTENEINQNRAKKSRESDILFCRQLPNVGQINFTFCDR